MSKQNLFGRFNCGLYGITAWALWMPLPTCADEASADQTLLQSDDAQISLIQNTFIAAPIAGVVARRRYQRRRSREGRHFPDPAEC